MGRSVRIFLLLIAGLLPAAGPAPAAEVPRAAVFAADDDGWGVRKVMARFRTRTGVIQLAIGCMAVALFIMMRKFADPPRGTGRPPSSRGE
jgi:hypothetical protein